MNARASDQRRRKTTLLFLMLVAGGLFAAGSGSALFAEDDRFSDIGRGQWIMEFSLPDAYLPRGFVRDPNNRHWVVKTIDPEGAHKAHCHQYAVQPHAWVSNKRLSANPNGQDCPMGFGGAGEFIQREVAGASGFWRRGYVSPTRFQFNFLFEIGSCVMSLYMDAGEATPVKGNARFARPTEAEIWAVVAQFVEGYRRFISDKGWTDLEGKPSTVVGHRADPSVVPPVGPGVGSTATDVANVPQSAEDGAVTGVALGVTVVGALTALGAGVMMLGMGVSPRDVIDGAVGLFGGGATETTTAPREPLTEAQRGAAAHILAQNWENVSPEEMDLLRTSPDWLKKAMKQTMPAVTIEGYQPSLWREGATAGLKAAQSYIDAAVGIFSSATGNLPMAVHYTYWKNMLGGTSEGVADWVWGRNDRGLLRNVAEGFTRGSIKGGVELAVDLAAGKAIHNPVAEYAAGQVAKYAVGAAGDAAVNWTDPPGTTGRPLRAEGLFDTTSPLEKDALDALLMPENWPRAEGPPAPPLPYMAQNVVQ